MKSFFLLGALAATAFASSRNSFAERTDEGILGGTILRPARPPGHDDTDLYHLMPKLTHELHYRADGSTG